MKSITRKGDIKNQLEAALLKFSTKDVSPFVAEIHKRILKCKARFPLLEYCAGEICAAIPASHHTKVMDGVAGLQTIGGNVLIGIMLQKKSSARFSESIAKAAEYIEKGHAWYVTDIIGERVYGWNLLHDPTKTITALKKLCRHESTWVVRSIGAGAHFAIKKGLDAKNAEAVFKLLLSLGEAEDFHVRTGIGWAAKTTAKFHPAIISKYKEEISSPKVGNWFRRKVKIGLERSRYAKTRRS
jgi:hypothetical protein